MFFQSKRQNNVDPSICNPIIVNQTNQSIVVFQDRGVLYNKQVLEPGEALGMSRKETAGSIVPYCIHALVGDERNLPTRLASAKNLLSTAVIPTAFVVGTLVAASSAGTLTGPSAAVGRAASGMVVRGMVIDSAAIAAGSLMASRAATVAEMLIEKHPENFMTKSGRLYPGKNYVVVRGGIDAALKVSTISEKEFRKIPINGTVKEPMDTLKEKMDYYLPSLLSSSKSKKGVENEALIEGDSAARQSQSLPHQTTVNQPMQQQQQQPATPAIQQQGQESEEDRQLRIALAESLRMEQERQQRQQYNSSNNVGEPAILYG